VKGLISDNADELDLTIDEINEQMLPVEGLEQIGTGTLTSRTWRQASISVLAIDAVPISKAINQIVPEAAAKVSMRIPPGQDAAAALSALKTHLEASVPWGAEVTLSSGGTASAFELDTSGPAYDAFRKGMAIGYDHEPLEIGVGGSIPFVAAFSERYPDASILLVGASDPMSRYHGPNESLELADLKSAIIAQAIALTEMGS
jgi:acetylornithine deacetylase/succinyl-diaminopimelate desuccinylase-like protein